MNKSPKETVFFIDRCLGSKQIVKALRQTGITVEIHDDHFDKNAQDVDWLPEVGKKGWLLLTKDANIGKNTLERMAVTNAGIRMFILASQNLSGTDMANIFQEAIIKMQDFVRKHPAPFIAKVYRDGRIEMWRDNEELLNEIQ